MRVTRLLPAAIAAISSFFAGCEQEIDFQPEAQEKLLVLNSIQGEGEVFNVHVSESVPIIYADYGANTTVENANLQLFGNDVYLETLEHVGSGRYVSSEATVTAGTTYRLEATHPDFPDASADFTAPAPPQVENATIGDVQNDFYHPVSFDLVDEEGIDDYYMLEVYTDGWVADPRLLSFSSNDPNLLYGSGTEPSGGQDFFGRALWSDAGRDGMTMPIDIEVELPFGGGLWIYVEIKRIPRNYYLYLLTVREQQDTGFDPFAQPGIIDNQVEGGIGLFTGYSKTRESWFIM